MKRNVSPRVAGGMMLGLCLGAAGSGGAGAAPAGEKLPAPKLIEMAGSRPNEPRFREALVATLDENRIKAGTAIIGEGPDFLWAIESSSPPQLIVDEQARPAMTRIQGTDLWFETGKLTPGQNHTYYYVVHG